MLDFVFFAPSPISARPQRAGTISAVLDEVHELAIGNVLIFHAEGRNAHRQSSALVVPTEILAVGTQPKCCRPFWDFDQVMADARRTSVALDARGNFGCPS